MWFILFLKKLGIMGSVLLVLVIFLLVVCGYLYYQWYSTQKALVRTSNTLAQSDSLHEVLTLENQTLSIRYSEQVSNVNKIANENKILKKYIDDKDLEVKSLITKVEEVSIQNQILAGKLSHDSAGNAIGNFDTTSSEYSLKATAQLQPLPILTIHSLMLIDSSNVGIAKINSSGLVEGFITHSNPHVRDKNARFVYQLSANEGFSLPSLKVNLLWLPISFGVGVGLAYLLTR